MIDVWLVIGIWLAAIAGGFYALSRIQVRTPTLPGDEPRHS